MNSKDKLVSDWTKPEFRQKASELEIRLNYTFKDRDLLKKALTHKSHHNEVHSLGDNERLEFIGDAVLGLSVGSWLMEKYPHFNEGMLSKVRASLVNEKTLSDIAIRLRMDREIRLGRGETKSGGAGKPRLMASVYEAVVGAMFLEAGYQRVHQFIGEIFQEQWAHLNIEDPCLKDYKTQLQEKTQEHFQSVPIYRVIKEEGPAHDKIFYVEVCLKGRLLGSGKGKSKKQAEQEAARKGLESSP